MYKSNKISLFDSELAKKVTEDAQKFMLTSLGYLGMMEPIYRDGILLKTICLEQIRSRIESSS